MSDYLRTAVDAALRAGGAILEIYKRDFDVEYKSDESPLTEADKAAHHIILDALEELGLPILSEESKSSDYEERRNWEKYWLVDPLDGTKEFIKKNGEFTVNIALIENGNPVLGVVYAPVLQTLYCGMQITDAEQGAWMAADCSGKTMDEIFDSSVLLPVSEFSGSLIRVVASRSHCNKETEHFIKGLESRGKVEMVSSGSSLKLCLVAEGKADVYPRIAPTMEWDTAAAQAVVEASGARVVEYNPGVSPTSYLEKRIAPELCALHYNKQDLLNPYFVVFR